jgi:hypothetical protein
MSQSYKSYQEFCITVEKPIIRQALWDLVTEIFGVTSLQPIFHHSHRSLEPQDGGGE